MRRFVFTALILSLLSSVALCKIYVDIKSPGVTKLGIGIKFEGERLSVMETVFKRDLLTYGIFRLYPLDRIELSMEDLKLIGADLLASVETHINSNKKLDVTLSVFDTSENKILMSKAFEGDEAAEILIAHKMADDIYQLVTGDKGMFSYPAVAVRKVAGGYELCLLDVGARVYKRVLFSNRPIQSPVLSPDGRKIAFSMMRKGDFDIYILDVEKGVYNRVCFTSGPDTAPFWSPDGNKLIFSGNVGDNPELFLCDIRTGKLTRLTRSIAIETSPAFSPDGSKIVFVSNRTGHPNIYYMDLRTKRAIRISSGYYDVSPEWSPTEDAIIYSSVVEGNYLIKLYYLDTGATEIVGVGEDPTWSPNGDYILFKRLGGLFLKSIYGNNEIKIFSGRWENPFWR